MWLDRLRLLLFEALLSNWTPKISCGCPAWYIFGEPYLVALSKIYPLICLSLMFLGLMSCAKTEDDITRISARVTPPSEVILPGKHALNLGSILFINTGFYWRDGFLYIPKSYQADKPAPLMIWLHGGGGHATDTDAMMPIADEYGIVLLSLDSRHNTWDGIDSPFGPDVRFIDRAMRHTFERVAINETKVVLAGLSDGASYALALGRSNGDVFTHLAAVAPWRLSPPSELLGKPSIYIAHGTRDNVYPHMHSRHFVVPALKNAGYNTTYAEFDAPHWATEPIVRAFFEWILNSKDTHTKDNKTLGFLFPRIPSTPTL